MILGRLLMRLLLVPLGGGIAVSVGMMFVLVAEWNKFAALTAPDDYSTLATFVVVGPTLALSMGLMLLPMTVGALIAEAFAIRTWIYHIVSGGLSAWVSLVTVGALGQPYDFRVEPLIAVGAGIVAGFAYWAVAGWSAGFWKPVFERPDNPALRASRGT